MPKSKRSKVVHMTQVNKKTREDKDRLFENIRKCIPEYQYCFVFSVDNMRNTYLKDVRQELSDSRLFFGKTKLMARALGHSPEDSYGDNIYHLTPYLRGTVGLIFTNRAPGQLMPYLETLSQDKTDFARAGAISPRDFVVPYGTLYSTGGEVPAEYDVPIGHTLEPELRRLGVPVRMIKGRVALEEGPEGPQESGGYVVCREGDVLDSRQTRLLKLFSVCLSEFKIKILAYWSAATTNVTRVDPEAMDDVEDNEGSD
ncbi:ribosomal protein L10 [Rostrohypoxylon terebratum]|nr:ribosomal protein L10 [Rostrohypoxylon terebratum]